MSKQSSLIWTYFKVNAIDNSKANCNICKASISRGGKDCKSYTTSNLVQHLRCKHIIEHGLFQSEKREKEASQSTAAAAATPRIMTLDAMVDKMQPFAFDDPRAISWNKVVAEFMVLDVQPFSIVEDVGFRRLMSKAEPRYKLPGRKYFSTSMIPDMHRALQSKVRDLVSAQTAQSDISLTSDAWSDPSIGVGLLSLTAHWLTEEFERRQVILAATPLDESHTGEYLASKLTKLCEEYQIPKTRIHVLLRDGGANMVKAMRLTEIDSITCFAHTLQLVVSDGILSQRVVKDVLAISRSIVGKFRHSILAQQQLEEQQEKFGVAQKRLVQDVQTRWNSTYNMLVSLYEQKQVLGAYATLYDLPSLTAQQWILINNIVDTLGPFADITKEVSNSQTSASVILPMLKMLRLLLAREHEESLGIQTMRRDMLDSLNRRFVDVTSNKKLVLATILDPRYKHRLFGDEALVTRSRQWLRDECIKVASAEQQQQPPTQKRKIETEKKCTGSSTSRLWDLFSEACDEPVRTVSDTTTHVDDAVDAMLELYLAGPLLPREEDMYSWWNLHRFQYPYLAQLARRYLSAPASSVPSEQLFSAAGQIFSDRRGTLCAEKGEMLLLLKYNLPQLGFKY